VSRRNVKAFIGGVNAERTSVVGLFGAGVYNIPVHAVYSLWTHPMPWNWWPVNVRAVGHLMLERSTFPGIQQQATTVGIGSRTSTPLSSGCGHWWTRVRVPPHSAIHGRNKWRMRVSSEVKWPQREPTTYLLILVGLPNNFPSLSLWLGIADFSCGMCHVLQLAIAFQPTSHITNKPIKQNREGSPLGKVNSCQCNKSLGTDWTFGGRQQPMPRVHYRVHNSEPLIPTCTVWMSLSCSCQYNITFSRGSSCLEWHFSAYTWLFQVSFTVPVNVSCT
jgi:hypothetical protein